MAELQRIFVVSTAATEDEVRRLRRDAARNPVVLVAPTPEAKRVAQDLGGGARPETLLAPVRFPAADRGHQLDTLVRHHALGNRETDVVAVMDPASVTLLLRVLAPDQLSTGGAVTAVGLPRAARPASLPRVAVLGLLLGVVAVLAEPALPILVLPAVVTAVGLGLLVLARWRTLAREVALSGAAGAVVAVMLVASSERFPG